MLFKFFFYCCVAHPYLFFKTNKSISVVIYQGVHQAIKSMLTYHFLYISKCLFQVRHKTVVFNLFHCLITFAGFLCPLFEFALEFSNLVTFLYVYSVTSFTFGFFFLLFFYILPLCCPLGLADYKIYN